MSDRASMIAGGESGEPAIVPNDPHAGTMIARITSPDEYERMPPSDALPTDEIKVLSRWIAEGASWPSRTISTSDTLASATDDAEFLRRVYLDTVGVPPTESEARSFFADQASDKRSQLIDQLVNDDRVADQWMGYWQDVLAENPNLLKPSLNNSGPFRWFLYDAMRDRQPIDRMVTELIMLRGSRYEGGAAGFAMAADNDVPMAARSIVLASAFLGEHLQCARCHDSPYHDTTQRDLFSLAAMWDRSPITVPKTSTVPAEFFDRHAGRPSLITATLKAGQKVKPDWTFTSLANQADLDPAWIEDDKDPRSRLAALVTSPTSDRFAKVIVNRVWKRLVGTGIVEPAGDWQKGRPSHPELLDFLAAELIAHDYDLRHVMCVIMSSDVYGRKASGTNADAESEQRTFDAPDRRRMVAEQVVDSMVVASGKPLRVEPLCFDPEARRPAKTMIHMGNPSRAWMLTSLSNERDRPSLAFPRANCVTDVMEAFGWTGSRQSAIEDRQTDPNVLQSGVIANSVFASWMTAASDQSDLADLAVNADDAASLIESLFLHFLTRMPTDTELQTLAPEITSGFDDRVVPIDQRTQPTKPEPLPFVSWSNHLSQQANAIKVEEERRAIEGDSPDPRLDPDWRRRYEDVVWAIMNSPEFVWIP